MLAEDSRFAHLGVAFHIEPERDLSTHEIVVDVRRGNHLVPALLEFARKLGLKSHAVDDRVMMSLGRGY